MAGNPAPDWYPDPTDPAVLRWWDGTRWSGETRSAPAASGGPQRQEGPAAFAPGSPGPQDQAHPPSQAHPPAQGYPPAQGHPPGMGAPGDPGPAGRSGLQASWREPAIESWATVYRAADTSTKRARFPLKRWVLGGLAAVIVVGVAAWFIFGALNS